MVPKLPFWGVICLGLCAMQVISFPLSSPANEDDNKVRKCIVEVISDTLSKPSPVPISQNCLETLRGDERIISILRHQNLLKELQELASQAGATERVQKKAAGFEEELSGVLERQNNKPVPSDKLEGIPPGTRESSFGDTSSESTERKRQPEEEEKAGYQQERSREDNNAEELESNDIEKREEAPEGEETDNHITDTNYEDLPRETEDDTSHNSKETEAVSQKESSEADEKREDGKDYPKQESNETEEDETQREDNSRRFSEDHNSDKGEADVESESSKEERKPEAPQEVGHSHQQETKSDEETASNELEDSKRFNKMDELAKQLTSKKWVEENSSEEAQHPSAERKYDAASEDRDDRQQWKQSRDDGNEKESQIAKRPDPEERKEEEGSANRKTEDTELESLAAIEAELENVAHKLHELRRV